MGRKIAIVGAANREIEAEKLLSLDSSWEIWGINNLYGINGYEDIKYTRWYEIHDFERIKRKVYKRRGWSTYGNIPIYDYLLKINDLKIPVYMKNYIGPIKRIRIFPFDEIMRTLNTKYFGCSFTWMMGQALCEHIAGKNIDVISFYGVTLSGNEYYFQRPSLERLIGRAEGMGIGIYISEGSEILKSDWIYAYGEMPERVYSLFGSFTRDLGVGIMALISQNVDNAYESLKCKIHQ